MIPAPTPTVVPSSVRTRKSQKRSPEKLRLDQVKEAKTRAEYFLQWAQVIRVPVTLKKLKEAPVDKDELERICRVELGPDKPAQCVSARFVGQDGEPLFLYFGRRIIPKHGKPPVRSILTTR